MNNLLLVAQIGKTVGLKGALKFHITSDFYDSFSAGTSFVDEKENIYKIKSFNKNNNIVIFENFEDIQSAKRLVNKKLYQTQEYTKENCKLLANEYFYFDIIGCSIIEDEINLGIVSSVDRFNDRDYFLIDANNNLGDDMAKTFLIPYEDYYIIDVDLDKKQIYTKNTRDILENS